MRLNVNGDYVNVDGRGAVKQLSGLRVVDASIIPVVPSVAINPTTVMLAERISQGAYAAAPRVSNGGVRMAQTA